MEFREFIRKPFVVYEEEQPVVSQPEQPKGNIIQPDKRLTLPKEETPKTKERQSEVKLIDAFPNARKPMGTEEFQKLLSDHDPKGSVMAHLEDQAEIDIDYLQYGNLEERFEELRKQRPSKFRWDQDRSLDSEEDKKWRQNNDEYNKLRAFMGGNIKDLMGDTWIHQYTTNRLYASINHYLRNGEILIEDQKYMSDDEINDPDYEPMFDLDASGQFPYGLGEGDDAQKHKTQMEAYIHLINKAVLNQQKYKDMPPRMYSRRIKEDVFKDLQIGDIISDPAFMSVTRDLKDRIPSQKKDEMFGETVMNIFGGKDRYDVYDWIEKLDEEETIFAPGSQLRYRGKDDGGQYMFDQVGFNRDDYDTISEGKIQKPIIKKVMKQISKELLDRMNDFQFEVLKPEEEELETQQPEPKQFRDILKKMVDLDD